jgi:hypothetical protein
MMASTLLLDTVTWDLTLDTSGNIAVAVEPYALAQDAASAIKLFSGELYYDTTQGVPYFSRILGQQPPMSLVKHYLNSAAMTVPGVASAQTYLVSWTDRTFSGQVQITAANGATSTAGI